MPAGWEDGGAGEAFVTPIPAATKNNSGGEQGTRQLDDKGKIDIVKAKDKKSRGREGETRIEEAQKSQRSRSKLAYLNWHVELLMCIALFYVHI